MILSFGTSTNLLRVALLPSDARCTLVQLRFSDNIAAARDGFSSSLLSLGFTNIAFTSYRTDTIVFIYNPINSAFTNPLFRFLNNHT
jgi:hypothetical protein